MAPEAPADTAGPSSPPPQLPEGWLPQWEGVGRKWYYVQRTTGKSQWEIPTEPIVLTPSTTPTPSGAGLSQEPKSYPTSNNTRELESTDRMAGEMYSAADSAKISVGNRAHYVCTGQHLPGRYEQQMAANAAGYGPNPLHQGPVGHLNGVQPAFYGSQTHPGYQITGPHHIGQSISSSMWGNNSGTYQGNPGSYNMTQHAQSFQGFSADPVGLHNHQPPASWTITSNPQGEMARSIGGASDSQPQWQLEPQQGHLNGSGEGVPMNLHPSNMTKPFFGSYSSNQHAEPSSREFARRVSNPSLVQEGQPYQTSAENFHNHSPHSMVEQVPGITKETRSHYSRSFSAGLCRNCQGDGTGTGDSTAAVKKHVYTLKARQRAISAQSFAKAKTDKPTDCGDKGTKTTTKRKIDSPTKSEVNAIVENQDEDGFEPSASPNKQRKL
ncbi:hypothetical protein CBS147355_6710 [Penicillium roqueforti]|nr:hypothetical protein CBS147355_6710 [Penicillium roqueforti]KAI3127671.1 hypothetical protein CBS147330_5845 [Penicillium roqueforti]KAI3137252.1 hypothetical protein CBS147326_3501 [Penicillium roqueforti]